MASTTPDTMTMASAGPVTGSDGTADGEAVTGAGVVGAGDVGVGVAAAHVGVGFFITAAHPAGASTGGVVGETDSDGVAVTGAEGDSDAAGAHVGAVTGKASAGPAIIATPAKAMTTHVNVFAVDRTWRILSLGTGLMDTDTVRLWPLPIGHRFGPEGFDLRNHDGRTSISDSRALLAWQDAYRHRIKRLDFPGGYYSGVTQMAALHVQELAGLPATGMVDADTWAAVWTVVKPAVAPPAVTPAPTRRQLRLRAHRQRDYWRRVSNRVEFTQDGSQPPWWPGRPFGPGEHGWHVEVLQDLVQARKTGVFNHETKRRVRALRRVHGLPVSDVVDLPLAVALDPGPWT